jgi:hypothetical protein
MPKSQFKICAYLKVAKKSVDIIHAFFYEEFGIARKHLISNMHLTVYYSRRPMPMIEEVYRGCHMVLDTYETKFMVLTPGGENPKDHIVPEDHKIGVRVKRISLLRESIYKYREYFYEHETTKVLGKRKPSTKSRNAFGAKSFQPHISLLHRHNGIIDNLTVVGEMFREFVPEIYFDKFVVINRKNF